MSLDSVSSEVQGFVLAVGIAIVRVIYDREETKPVRVFMEAAICGGLSIAASGAISALGLSSDWVVFAGGAIGYLGSTTVRALAVKYLNAQTSRG